MKLIIITKIEDKYYHILLRHNHEGGGGLYDLYLL